MKQRITIRSLLHGGTVISFLFLTLVFFSCSRKEEEKEAVPLTDYYSVIRSVDKLVLSEMTISKMSSVEDLKLDEAQGSRQKFEAFLNCFKLGTRKGAYSYNTYLRAYIDLGELERGDVEIDTVARTMKIRLPEVRTEFIGRDVGIKEEHYRVTGLRSSIRPEERAKVKEAMNESLRKEVEERAGFKEALRRSAIVKAKAYFSAFASENGYIAEITVKGE